MPRGSHNSRLVTRADVAAVLNAHPLLSAYGLGHGGQAVDKLEFGRSRRYLLNAVDQVQCAADWLRRHPHAAGSSYRLKHDVERASAGSYVSNGALIVALILLDWPMRPCRDCPNPVVVIKRTAPGSSPSAAATTRPAPTGTSR